MLVRSKIYHANELSIDFSRYDVRECRCIGPLLNAKRNELLCCLNGLMREPYKIARDDRILSVTIEYGLGIPPGEGSAVATAECPISPELAYWVAANRIDPVPLQRKQLLGIVVRNLLVLARRNAAL